MLRLLEDPISRLDECEKSEGKPRARSRARSSRDAPWGGTLIAHSTVRVTDDVMLSSVCAPLASRCQFEGASVLPQMKLGDSSSIPAKLSRDCKHSLTSEARPARETPLKLLVTLADAALRAQYAHWVRRGNV